MPILDARTIEFFSRSPEQTRRLGMKLGGLLQKSDLVCLSGDLGSGKTTLMQGLARGWGSLDLVSSPTFVLVNQYRRNDGVHLFHLDAYRLAGPQDAIDLDLDLILEQGALVIEWAERIRPALPVGCLWIHMRYIADEQRGMVFTGQGERAELLLAQVHKKISGG